MIEFTDVEDESVVYKRFFSINLDLLCITDIDGHFFKLNKSWESILGYNLKELEGRVFLDFVHPDDLEATSKILSELGDEQTQVLKFTNRYKCKNGTYRYIEWCPQPYGKHIYTAGRDIAEQIVNEQKLETAKVKLNAILGESLNKFIESTGIEKKDAMKMLLDYVEYLPLILDKIKENIYNENAEEISKLAHQIKGSAGNLRIDPIYELAIVLEQSALNKDLNNCKNILIQIRKLI